MNRPRSLSLDGSMGSAFHLGSVVTHLERGGLVIMPTETVYGFGGLVKERPLSILRGWKGRTSEKPFLLLIPGPDHVPDLVWTQQALDLAGVFWPGALTLVLQDPKGTFPSGVRSPLGGVAVRVSPHPFVKSLMGAVRAPLISTSANRPGDPPARSGGEALETALALGADDTLWILDGGFLQPSESSTIIDCTGAVPKLLRAGAIPLNRVRCVLPEIHDSSRV